MQSWNGWSGVLSKTNYRFPAAEIQRISFLDFPQLLFSARHGIHRPPQHFADKFDLFVERSFEDGLGAYDFVGFQKGEYYIGLRMLISSPKKNLSFVSVIGAPHDEKKYLISQALGVGLGEILEFEDAY